MWDEPWDKVKSRIYSFIYDPKRCGYITTAARWSWKLTSAKECVTTQLPNVSVLKMDDTKMNKSFPCPVCYEFIKFLSIQSRRASYYHWKLIIKFVGDSMSADLGSSSNYSSEVQVLITLLFFIRSSCVSWALKTVVGKGFLRLALMQELAGPKCLPKGVLRFLQLRNDTKGKQVNILVL